MREQQEREEAKGQHQNLVLPRIKDSQSQPQLNLRGIYGRDASGESREREGQGLVRVPSS